MPIDDHDIDALAARILQASAQAASIEPLTRQRPELTQADARRIAARVVRLREARGERPVGWKIGFTNRTIWDEYSVHSPIWGPMYDTTVAASAGPGEVAVCPVGRFLEPRIEPEIVFRFAQAPAAGMDEAALLGCIDGVTHGFEIVQSLFPGWIFRVEDTIAAFALHACLRHNAFVSVDAASRATWLPVLARFDIVLSRDGIVVDRGEAKNVLDGPLSALRHFVDGLADDPFGRGIRAGDIVTTGTLTRAFPVHPGETWSTALTGVPLAGMRMRIEA